MKWALLIFWLFLFAETGNAQNWQTVKQFDTVYYSAGKHSSYGGHYFQYLNSPIPGVPDTSLLRISFTTGVSGINGDSIFNFYTTVRDTFLFTPSNKCVDTLAPSWLGSHMIHKLSGVEYYFNSFHDTISIHTLDLIGSSWTIAHDTSGLIFKGRISLTGTTIVDGVLDSFKTITIQAYSGNLAVAHPYNNKVFQLSKNHGWLQNLDLFRFPNTINTMDRTACTIDSTQHKRLPKWLMNPGPSTVDLNWKYTPGNEWIYQEDKNVDNNPDFTPETLIVTHDSVLAFTLLNANAGIVSIKTETFWKLHRFIPPSSSNPAFSYFDSSSTMIRNHSDTVFSVGSAPFISMEQGPLKSGIYYGGLQSRYFVQTFDSAHYFITRSDLPPISISRTAGCVSFGGVLGAPDDASYFQTYMPGFGQTVSFAMTTFNGGVYDDYVRYIYMKLGNSIFGKKINVSKLDVGAVTPEDLLSISPNPANSFVTITKVDANAAIIVSLCSISGQMIRSLTVSEKSSRLNTSDIPSGIYFLNITDGVKRQVAKVLVQH